MQIAKSYYDKAADKRAALRALIEGRDPAGILQTSGFGPSEQR